MIIVQNPGKDEDPEQIIGIIRKSLSEKQRDNQLPYDLEFSIGWDELKDKNDNIHDCLKRADKKLYLDKRR